MEHKYNKGSEWRKWDLHVHTPASIFHNYNADDLNDVWNRFIIDIESLPKEIKVIGINDYLFIDGYRRILQEKDDGRMSNIELFLPVIELRLAKFGGNKQFKRVNFHVIFSDEITAEVIQSQFLNALSAKYTLTHGVNKDWWGGVIDKGNLKQLGEKIIESIPEHERVNYESSINEGFNNLNLEETQILEVLHNYHGFSGKFITAIGKTEWDDFKWNDSSISEKKTIINNVDMVFTAAETVENFRKAKEKLKEQKVNDLLLDCSDAHYNIDSKNKDRLGNCNTWIKADTTFDGLKQIICEPEDRVRIQIDHPDDKKSYNIIEKIKFVDTSGQNKFPSEEIGLSSGLNAIIGGKSSGKSLLLHMIASEMGNKTDIKNYQDVTKKTSIEIYYKDDPGQKRTKDDARIIEFLPQLHIENLVRNQEHKTTTYRSLNEFIENLIKQDESIKAIFEASNSIITEAISSIESAITEWGKLDAQLNTAKEERNKLGDKKAIENEIERIVRKIDELTKNAGWTPEEKTLYDKLIAGNQTQEANKKAFEQSNEEYSRLENYIVNQVSKDIDSAIRFTSVNDAANGAFVDFKRLLNKSLAETITLSSTQIKENIKKNIGSIDAITTNITANIDELKPLMAKNAIQAEVAKLELLKKEEEKRLTVIADKDLQIKQLRENIAKLNFVKNNITIKDSYYELSTQLNAAIADKWSMETTKLDIQAKTVFNKVVFVDSIGDIINMKSYLSNQFGNGIFNYNDYEYNTRNHGDKIAKLVKFAIKEDDRFLNFKQGKTTKEFLSAILKNCFTIEYDIKKGADSIHSMSEGKKGIVILQLYLSFSQSDCPILIDQPEDNLDNRTVYQDLNDYIKQCKRKRQIIMVSHNANLVVNTDAENVIVANQNGENGSENRNFKFEYVNGSLENTFANSKEIAILYKQGIREHVCEILEGGVDAFKKREDKYHIKS